MVEGDALVGIGDAAGFVEGVGGFGRVNMSEEKGSKVLKSTGSLSEHLSTTSVHAIMEQTVGDK